MISFGQGAVDILARLGIDTQLSTEEVLDYQKISDLYTEQGREMEKFLGQSYLIHSPTSENLSHVARIPDLDEAIRLIILALALCQGGCGRNIKLQLIQRQRLPFCGQGCIFYRNSLRQRQSDQDFLERFMPSLPLFEQASKVSWDDSFLLRYQIFVKSRP